MSTEMDQLHQSNRQDDTLKARDKLLLTMLKNCNRQGILIGLVRILNPQGRKLILMQMLVRHVNRSLMIGHVEEPLSCKCYLQTQLVHRSAI